MGPVPGLGEHKHRILAELDMLDDASQADEGRTL
jgi:hypothetical protein